LKKEKKNRTSIFGCSPQVSEPVKGEGPRGGRPLRLLSEDSMVEVTSFFGVRWPGAKPNIVCGKNTGCKKLKCEKLRLNWFQTKTLY